MSDSTAVLIGIAIPLVFGVLLATLIIVLRAAARRKAKAAALRTASQTSDTRPARAALSKRKKASIGVGIVIIAIIAGLWFGLIGPGMYSSKMLAAVYPASSTRMRPFDKEAVPEIPIEAVTGDKAVALVADNQAFTVSWTCTTSFVPRAFRTSDPGQVRYVIFVIGFGQEFGNYTNGYRAVQRMYNVSIIDRTTNKVIAKTTLGGELPPNTIDTSDHGYIGRYPSSNELRDWVASELPPT